MKFEYNTRLENAQNKPMIGKSTQKAPVFSDPGLVEAGYRTLVKITREAQD